ncbi:MAG: molecular chaperone HtpG, partial [Gammaproteobacteria bacterium]|nr:molecular chaperone HtpG [Gammaproteobacteria bacterium]
LKEGAIEDASNKERVAKLLRFASTETDSAEQSVSLEDYVARIKEGQEKIYFITAESYVAAKNSPHLEVFRKKGIEVLLLSDRIDEWLVQHLTEFDGKPMQSILRGDLDLDSEDDKAEKEKLSEEFKGVTEKVKNLLGDKVSEVRMSQRLTDSPSCLVLNESDMSDQMQKILEAAGQYAPKAQPVLELNADHELVKKLQDLGDDALNDWAMLLFEQAALAAGNQLEDSAEFVKRVNRLLSDRG